MKAMTTRIVQMAGVRYHRVVGLATTGRVASGDLKWSFRCDCGNVFETSGYSVRSGKVRSCNECAVERSRQASVTHGLSGTTEFDIWTGIISRCTNKKSRSYPRYGGRGIHVCERWASDFEAFLSDMGPRPSLGHSIERKNNDGHYEPGNCIWATAKEQANNKRSNRLVTVNGVTKTVAQWADSTGLSYDTLWQRLGRTRATAEATEVGPEFLRPQSEGVVEFNGIRDTYKGWSKRTGLKLSTIAMRINAYNWPVERALTQGVKS